MPRWRGEPLAGAGLLVWGEQGVGDEIVFASVFPELARLDGPVLVECAPKLAPLFARSFPSVELTSLREPGVAAPTGAFAWQVPAGTLAARLRPRLDAFPDRRAYLRADPARVRHWQQQLATLGPGVRVGFCWRSGKLAEERALACASIDQWLPLLATAGVHWVCLQYGDCAAELAHAGARVGVPLNRYPQVDYFDDLDEVAALMSALDLVISAPTAVSIQAAALGVETWQLTFGADWQTLGTPNNPWLPALVRVVRRGDQPWEAVIEDVARRLAVRAAGSEWRP